MFVLVNEFWRLYRQDYAERDTEPLEILTNDSTHIDDTDEPIDVFEVYVLSENPASFRPLLALLLSTAVAPDELAFIGTTVVEHGYRAFGKEALETLEELAPDDAIRRQIMSGAWLD